MANLTFINVTIPPGSGDQTKFESRFNELVLSLYNTVNNQRFSFEYIGFNQHTYFYTVCDERYQGTIEGLIYSMFPDAEIKVGQDYTLSFDPQKQGFAGAEIVLRDSDVYPIQTYDKFESDSMSRYFSSVSKMELGEQGWTQVIIEPKAETGAFYFRRRVRAWIARFKTWFSVTDRLRKDGLRGINKTRREFSGYKDKDKPFSTTIRCCYIADRPDIAKVKLNAVLDSFTQFNDDDINGFKPKKSTNSPAFINKYRARVHGDSYFLSSREVSTIYHYPNADAVSHVVHVLARKSDPPKDLPKASDPDVSPFGTTNYHNNFVPFGIKRKDRRRHLYAIGKSGSGKSKMLELLIYADVMSGQGVCVLDPHGDLCDAVLKMVPEERIQDVIIFDPSDTEFPIAFNPLMTVDPKYKMQLTIGIIEIFKKLFGDNWSDRLEHVLRYTLLALLDSPNTTVLSILKMLTDKNYRQQIVSRIQDNVVKNFWVSEFAGWSEKFDATAITPLLNKVGQFVATDMIRNIVGQPETKFDIRDVMDNRKILLLKVSKGLLGEENASLIGSMIITKIYQAAMSRADMAEDDRADFYFYVDEFQNFATETFYEIMSEARKYHLCLTIAHQYMGQLSDKIRQTVFGNVGSMISFRVGAEDARILAEEYNPVFTERDIINLGVREFYTKLSVNGELREAFSGRTLNAPDPEPTLVPNIITWSRQTYCMPKDEVAKVINAWDEGNLDAEAPSAIVEEFEAPIV